MTDLLLAIIHHVAVFALAGLLAIELALVRTGLRRSDLPLLGRVDAAYGGLAGAVVVIGILRVLFGLRGWEYYVANHAFWGKMGVFVAVGLLSIPPTLRILAWRRAATGPADATLPPDEVSALRRYLKAQAVGFVLILAFAAAMARGYGS
jgi:putative membrane protein